MSPGIMGLRWFRRKPKATFRCSLCRKTAGVVELSWLRLSSRCTSGCRDAGPRFRCLGHASGRQRKEDVYPCGIGNGRFAWIMDPEGNRIESWEPLNEG